MYTFKETKNNLEHGGLTNRVFWFSFREKVNIGLDEDKTKDISMWKTTTVFI